MIRSSLFLPTLLLAGLLLPACTRDVSSSAAPSLAPGEAPTVANTPEPVIAASSARYNGNLPKRGDFLPAILGTTLSGTSVSNATLTGKTSLINIWFYH